MNLVRKAVSVLGAVSLAALLLVALASKTTRSMAAALVQVSNTSADPVPVEVACCSHGDLAQGHPDARRQPQFPKWNDRFCPCADVTPML